MEKEDFIEDCCSGGVGGEDIEFSQAETKVRSVFERRIE